MKHRFGATAAALCACFALCAQDVHFSQFNYGGIHESPALAGAACSGRINALYRNQRRLHDGGFQKIDLGYDRFVFKIQGGLGAYLQQDNDTAGIGRTKLMVAGSHSWWIASDSMRLSAGLELGIVHATVDAGKFFENEPVAALKSQLNYPDIGVGVHLFGMRYFIGFSAHHLNRPFSDWREGNNSRTAMLWKVMAGANFPVDSRNSKEFISPSVFYTRQGDSTTLNLGVCWTQKVLLCGLYYRNADAFILMCGINVSQFRLLYSYDFDARNPGSPSGGTHEVGLQVLLRKFDPETRAPFHTHY